MTNNEAYGTKASAAAYLEQYPNKDYAAEAVWLNSVIQGYAPGASEVLDIGCGAGDHLAGFASLAVDGNRIYRKLSGVDKSKHLLDVARARVPEATLQHADMREFNLEKHHVVTSLFTAVSYLGEREALYAGIAHMAAHVDPDGLVMLEPWLTPEEFTPDLNGTLRSLDLKNDHSELMRRSVMYGPEQGQEGVVRMDMAFLHVIKGAGEITLNAFTEKHKIGLYRPETYIDAMEAAGLTFEAIENPPEHLTASMRPIYIGRQPA